jgi:putative Holliday junction resolvase
MTGGKRIVALDIGTVRIGGAASDPLGSFARGVAVLRASGEWMDELAAIADEYGADTLLVGMPRRTSGEDGPEAGRMREIIGELSARFGGLEIVPWDERFTTAIATRVLIEADVSRGDRKGQVDKVAAVVLLQSYLDSLRGGISGDGAPPPPDTAARKGGKRSGRKGKRVYD